MTPLPSKGQLVVTQQKHLKLFYFTGLIEIHIQTVFHMYCLYLKSTCKRACAGPGNSTKGSISIQSCLGRVSAFSLILGSNSRNLDDTRQSVLTSAPSALWGLYFSSSDGSCCSGSNFVVPMPLYSAQLLQSTNQQREHTPVPQLFDLHLNCCWDGCAAVYWTVNTNGSGD